MLHFLHIIIVCVVLMKPVWAAVFALCEVPQSTKETCGCVALLSITPFIYHLSSSYPGHPAFSSGPHFLRGETTVPRLTSIAIAIATARRIPDTTLVEEYEAA